MRHPNPDIHVYTALADAYAAAVEYLKGHQDQIERALRFEGYMKHPTYILGKGIYTDDAEMSVANGRVLFRYNRPFTPIQFVESWLMEFWRGGMRKGYAPRFYDFLLSVDDADDFLERIKSDSDKNGGGMRAIPIGVLPNIQQVIEVADLQVRITHNTPAGRFCAKAVALISHLAMYTDLSFEQIMEQCVDHLPATDIIRFGHVFIQPWEGRVAESTGSYPVSILTVHAVVDLLRNQNSLMDIMRQLITWGGDTDTVAAIAWGIASARYQGEELPEFMMRDLEGGSARTGVPYLRRQGELLMNKYA